MKKLLLTIISLFVVSCGTVQEHRIVSQPLNEPLVASAGSTLFRLNKKGDLPNAFGGADIYGGKVDKGFSEVKLKAIRENGIVDLLVFDVSKDSAETTMDRYKRGVLVNVNQNVSIGNDTGNGLPVTIDTKADNTFIVSGVKITFLEVKANSVSYTLTDLQKK